MANFANAGDQETLRPWSQLPSPLLRLILSKLAHILDHILSRSVCTSWRSAAPPSSLRSQLPLLALPHHPASSLYSFFDLSTDKLATSVLPETRNKTICGSSFGWLALIDASDSSLSLFNPVTRAQVQLPPPIIIPYYLGPGVPRCMEEHRSNDEENDVYDLFRKGCASGLIRKGYPWKVCLSTSPRNDGCIVVVTLACAAEFAFCGLGDDAWTIVGTGVPWPLDSVCLHGQKFYVFDQYAVCSVYDRTNAKRTLIESPDSSFSVEIFHVVVADTELLMVLCVCSENFQVK